MVNSVQAPRINKTPDLQKLGFKDPDAVINFLAVCSFGGKSVINDLQLALTLKGKADQVIKFFQDHGVKINELPQLASMIKNDIRAGKVQLGGLA